MTGAPFTVYFYGEFSKAAYSARTFKGQNTDPMPRYHTHSNGGMSHPTFMADRAASGPMNDRVGALFTWDDGQAEHITSRVGISFMSIDKARSYINSEIPSWNLNDTVSSAAEEWNRDVFSRIQVSLNDTANKTHVRLLYSSLYFVHLMPSDRSGENPLWDSEEPYWDDFYTMCESCNDSHNPC